MNLTERLDLLTQLHTGFGSFKALTEADGNTGPSLIDPPQQRRKDDFVARVERYELADAYDRAQALRMDPRRAVRS